MPQSFQSVTDQQRLLLDSAQTLSYKSLSDGDDLDIHFYLPKNLKENEAHPAILFFNSGAFDRGQPIQFAPHALYFVERGAVCGLVNYRMKSTHPESSPTNSLQDGLSAVRFLRLHCEKLNIDPEKIIVYGAGAGANIAANSAMGIPVAEDSEGEKNPDVDAQANAAVLLSPITDITKKSYGHAQFKNNAECKRVSLSRHIKPGCPPMLVIHGNADRLIPNEVVEQFITKMRKKGNSCEYVSLEGRDNNFYNMNFDPVSFEICLRDVDAFLVKGGFLPERDDSQAIRIISSREKDY